MKETSQASEFYKNLLSQPLKGFEFLKNLVQDPSPVKEAEWIDFKSGLDKEVRDTWGKALSAFANSGGGILIWGIATRSEDGFDVPDHLELVANAECFAGKLTSYLSNVVEPPVLGVQIEAIFENSSDGFVVAFIPDSRLKPHQAKSENHKNRFFIRVGHQSEPAGVGLLRVLFYPQRNPILRLRNTPIDGSPSAGFKHNIALKNIGQVTVSNLLIIISDERGALQFDHNIHSCKKKAAVMGTIEIALIEMSHPGLEIHFGQLTIHANSKVFVTAFGRDMNPFMWGIEPTAMQGEVSVKPLEFGA